MRWEHAQWRKLYCREEGSFALLPLYVRAIAAELMKFCDDDGRIYVGQLEPWEAIARLAKANRSDRRLLKEHLPLLIADGYLVREAEHVRIKNLPKAQAKKPPGRSGRGSPDGSAADVDEPSSATTESNDRATTEQRPVNDGATTEQRPSNELKRPSNDRATKNELSVENDSGQSLVYARAHSDLNSTELSREEAEQQAAPAAGLGDPRGTQGQATDPPTASEPRQAGTAPPDDAQPIEPPVGAVAVPPSASNRQPQAAPPPPVPASGGPDLLSMASYLAERGNGFGAKMLEQAAAQRTLTANQRAKIRELYDAYSQAEAMAGRARCAIAAVAQHVPTVSSSPEMTYEAREAERRRIPNREPPPPKRREWRREGEPGAAAFRPPTRTVDPGTNEPAGEDARHG